MYERVLADFRNDLGAEEHATIRKGVIELRRQVATVVFEDGKGTLAIDGDPCGALPRKRPLYVLPGSRRLRLERRAAWPRAGPLAERRRDLDDAIFRTRRSTAIRATSPSRRPPTAGAHAGMVCRAPLRPRHRPGVEGGLVADRERDLHRRVRRLLRRLLRRSRRISHEARRLAWSSRPGSSPPRRASI